MYRDYSAHRQVVQFDIFDKCAEVLQQSLSWQMSVKYLEKERVRTFIGHWIVFILRMLLVLN